MTAIIPTDSDMRPPYTILLNRSRPNSSVPIQCLADGPSSRSALCRSGSWVATTGARAAIAQIAASTPIQNTATLLPRR